MMTKMLPLLKVLKRKASLRITYSHLLFALTDETSPNKNILLIITSFFLK